MNLREKLADELGRGVIADRVLKVLGECTCQTCTDWSGCDTGWGDCDSATAPVDGKKSLVTQGDFGCNHWRSK